MAQPAIGTQVLYHLDENYDIFGIIVQNADTWTAAMTSAADRNGNGIVPPADGQVYVMVFDPAVQQSWMPGAPSTQGTDVGQWSPLP
jgi:hypothetical protein